MIKTKTTLFSFFVDEKSILLSKHPNSPFLVIVPFWNILNKKIINVFCPDLMRFLSGGPYKLNKTVKSGDKVISIFHYFSPCEFNPF